jgi:hypothetical protein
MTTLKKGARITGANRSKLAGDLKKQYDKGASIRELADANGRSYGFIHRVLAESGVTLRGRGGATRSKATTATKAPAKAAVKTTTKASTKAAVSKTAPASKSASRRAKGK